MTDTFDRYDFVTEGRIEMARRHADDLAARNPDETAQDCAERAVRTVFGRWLLDPTAAIRPGCLPLYFRLVNRVEAAMGLHRRPRRAWMPDLPGAMAMPAAAEMEATA